MEQKVIKVGNSLAVTLPREYVKAQNLKAGQGIVVETEPGVDEVRISTKPLSSLTPEFKIWLDDMSAKNRDLIVALADR